MRVGTLFLAMIPPSLAAFWDKTLGSILPMANGGMHIFRRQRVIPDDGPTCQPLPGTTDRTQCGTNGCRVFCYPSTGGVLVKHLDPVDMLFLSIPPTNIPHRSGESDEEDQFCRRLLQTGATLWPDKRAWESTLFSREGYFRKEKKIMVYGWPSDNHGVWVLSYNHSRHLPHDFGRIRMATSMEERITIMKQYSATFVEDPAQIEELRFGQTPTLPNCMCEQLDPDDLDWLDAWG